jgi:cell wall assembly regulator SMI1
VAKPKSKAKSKSRSSSIASSIAAIEQWMRTNGAPRLANNLAAGATNKQLDAIAAKSKLKLPEDLRELYRVHDGQPGEQDCFIENMTLLPLAAAAASYKGFVAEYIAASSPHGVLAYNPYAPEWETVQLTKEEISKRWWPIAVDAREGLREVLAMNFDSGRVFWLDRKNPPHFNLAANSLRQFFELYERAVVEGRYKVTEGFGEYYLARCFEWVVPGATTVPAVKSAQNVVDETFAAGLGKSLMFLVEDVTVKGRSAQVVIAVHRPPAFHERLARSPFLKKSIADFADDLLAALPAMRWSVSLVPVDVDEQRFELYLRRTPGAAHLLTVWLRTRRS